MTLKLMTWLGAFQMIRSLACHFTFTICLLAFKLEKAEERVVREKEKEKETENKAHFMRSP